jgi:hypothetical protein
MAAKKRTFWELFALFDVLACSRARSGESPQIAVQARRNGENAEARALKLQTQLFNKSLYSQGLTTISLNSRLKFNIAPSPSEIWL